MSILYCLFIVFALACQLVLCAARLPALGNLSLYGIFIAAVLTGGLGLGLLGRRYLGGAPLQGMRSYAWTEVVWAALMLSAAYQAMVYDNSPALANRAFWLAALGALSTKLFWWEIKRGWDWLIKLFQGWWAHPWVQLMMEGGILLGIALLIYVPDMEAVVALSFVGEQWHHLDFFVMSPGWGSLMGQSPYVDIMSQYGVGIPVVLPRMAQWFGAFDYVTVLGLIMGLVIVYFLLMYVFLRAWLGSMALSVAAVLVAVRLQMMHYGISPLIWIYPSTTAVRLCFDVLFFWLLLSYVRRAGIWKLVAAGALAGGALFWMTSTGVMMMASFALFLFLLFGRGQERWRIRHLLSLLAVPLAAAFMLFYAAVGRHVFEHGFWYHLIEYLQFFSTGHGVLPIYDSLKYRLYLSSLVGFFIPLVYVATALYLGVLWWQRRLGSPARAGLAVVVAVYGLGQYSYYVVRSTQTGYDMVVLPFVWLCAFWAGVLIDAVPVFYHRRLKMVLVIVAAYALLTNHNFISYPNLFSWSKNPLVDPLVIQRFPDRQGYFNHQVKFTKEEDKLPLNSLGQREEGIVTEDNFADQAALKAYARVESDFSWDAKLIAGLVPVGARAAVVSSFETRLLMQAKRPPFFYHTPLITSRPMRVRTIPADAGHSPNFLEDTLRQLREQAPEFVFVERIMLTEPWPGAARENNASITAIMDYIKTYYTPFKEGYYLTALKHK